MLGIMAGQDAGPWKHFTVYTRPCAVCMPCSGIRHTDDYDMLKEIIRIIYDNLKKNNVRKIKLLTLFGPLFTLLTTMPVHGQESSRFYSLELITRKQQPGTVIPETPASRYIAVKTNLAAWAGTIVNIAADVQVGRHISVELPVLWCPWYAGGEHAVKTFTIQPEGRWWLSRPGEGHFFGVHAHIGRYSIKWKRDRYQDTGRPLLGAGISYGYLLPFNAHWAGEFTLGAGYANTRYDTYYNIDNGARINTRTKNYWGITRVGISVVYRFNLKK